MITGIVRSYTTNYSIVEKLLRLHHYLERLNTRARRSDLYGETRLIHKQNVSQVLNIFYDELQSEDGWRQVDLALNFVPELSRYSIGEIHCTINTCS